MLMRILVGRRGFYLAEVVAVELAGWLEDCRLAIESILEIGSSAFIINRPTQAISISNHQEQDAGRGAGPGP